MNRALIAQELWHQLWLVYRQQVPYAAQYQEMIESAGGTFVNDHIAFRSLRLTVEGPAGPINLGIPYFEDMIFQLGYEPRDTYEFPDKHLFARYYAHPEAEEYQLPKLFISELIVDELPDAIALSIRDTVNWKLTDDLSQCSSSQWSSLEALDSMGSETLLDVLRKRFSRLWAPPQKTIVEEVNVISQYGAWVLLYGFAVNHFTGYVNRQNTAQYPDLETTAQGLVKLDIPMKATIEGSCENGLKQTATKANTQQVSVFDTDKRKTIQITWPYAYFELAERFPLSGEFQNNAPSSVYHGFLRQQANHLFEMTRKY